MATLPERPDVMRDYFVGMVVGARNGNVEDARDVLRDFADTVENVAILRYPERAWSGPVPWQIAEYLAAAFRLILGGTNPARALNLVGKKAGRTKGKATTHNADALAAAFYLLTRKQSRPDGTVVGGLTPEQANRALQERLGVDRTTIQRARRQNQPFAYPKLISDEILKSVLKPYAAHVQKILDESKTSGGMNPSNSRRRKRVG